LIGIHKAAAASLCTAVFALAPVRAQTQAQDTVILSSVGSASANGWPTYIAVEKGFFVAEGLIPDIVFAQSNAAVIQQLAAGSVNVSTNSGLVDPIRAIEKGAPLALLRVEMQAPPYSLLAKPGIKSIGELKGKMVSVGGAKDITRIFVERMLEPNGVKPGEFDMTFAGATSARFAALQAGAVDAAILTPPFNFHAQTAGFNNLGNAVDYVDMPFSGMAVNTNWAKANRRLVEKLILVYDRSMAWLYTPSNRDEAIRILMKVSSLKREEIDRAYDFLIGGRYFEPTGRIPAAKLGKLIEALKALGDLPASFTTERLFLTGITQVAN
jgi:ABC-type nitrate/sulfonate/bicarbonate transport system substrate-binding protein